MTGEPSVPPHLKLAVDVDAAADLVSVGTSTIRRLVDEGVLARVPHTQRVLIARRELERWVESTMGAAS